MPIKSLSKKSLALATLALISILSLIWIFSKSQKQEPTEQATQISLQPTPVTFSISTAPAPLSQLPPFSLFEAIVIDENTLIGLDRSSRIVKNYQGKSSAISSSPVTSYSYNRPLVAFISESTPDQVSLLNPDTQKVAFTFPIKNYQPVVSYSFLPENSTLYFLGQYDPNTHQSNLYSYSQNKQPIKITSTTASKVEAINPSLVILSRSSDALDAGFFAILNPASNQVVSQLKGNFYHVSPKKDYIAIQSSTQVAIINSSSQIVKNIPITIEDKVSWKDDSTLVIVKTKTPNLEFTLFSPPIFNQSAQYLSESLSFAPRQVIGVWNKSAYLLDLDGNIWRITLP